MALTVLSEREAQAQQPDLSHRDLRNDEFWRRIPAFAAVDREEFLDHRFQARHSITKVGKLLQVLAGLVDEPFIADAADGFSRAPMAVRVSPYLLSLIDWDNPLEDSIRRQFIPLGSTMLPDHPELRFDSLSEQDDAPVPGLTHRYPDKALFLPVDTCPVYCRFCTRSYAVGPDSEQVEKVSLKVNLERWEHAFEYLRKHPAVEDVVISGGDAYTLKPEQLRFIGDALLDIEHVRRLRFATKGPAVMPQKLITDDDWLRALVDVVDRGRGLQKSVVVHTHFNHPNEITSISRLGLGRLFEAGVTVRNQTVLQRGVNDDVRTMTLLVRRLGYINVEPYYVYMHDLVRGVEDLRTTVRTAIDLEKHVRGSTAGFNTPTFVVDAPGGGGKRGIHSAEHYDEENGISVYAAPAVKPGKLFCYFNPLQALDTRARERWSQPEQRKKMIAAALDAAS